MSNHDELTERICPSCGGTGTMFYGNEHSSDTCYCQQKPNGTSDELTENLKIVMAEIVRHDRGAHMPTVGGPPIPKLSTNIRINRYATDFVEAIRADERKKLREALLSDAAVDEYGNEDSVRTRALNQGHARLAYHSGMGTHPWASRMAMDALEYGVEATMTAALAAIGLTEEGGAS